MRGLARAAMAEIEFLGWLGQAEAGDIIAYHAGFLAVDRHWSPDHELRRLADRAIWAAEHGLVHLAQRRLGPEQFSYLAIARARPRAAPIALAMLVTAPAQPCDAIASPVRAAA